MLTINPQYLVDDTGEKTAALLSIKEYRLLMKRLEDLEHMIEMDATVQTETEASQAELMGLCRGTTSGVVCFPQIGLGRDGPRQIARILLMTLSMRIANASNSGL